MKDSKFMDGLFWFVGTMVLVAVSWVLIGVVARAIKNLFCIGYGC